MSSIDHIFQAFDSRNLSDREREILRSIVDLYILRASPIGSRLLSKFLEGKLNLSPATLRNVMSDLEEMQYITHPHTSAGRIPTDKGYRFYVDTLHKLENLSSSELKQLTATLTSEDSEAALKQASKVLGFLSKYLGVVRIPHLKDMLVYKLELIPITSSRLIVVLALDSNIVRTVTLEAEFEYDKKYLKEITTYLNEKISGKSLDFVRNNFDKLILDFEFKKTPLVKLFIDSIDKIFERYTGNDRILTAGANNLLDYPEFEDLDKIRGVIELVENQDIIIRMIDEHEEKEGDVKILIGREMDNELMDEYSFILTNYKIGSATGSIGLIGPKRMNYSKMMSIVYNVSKLLSIDNQ